MSYLTVELDALNKVPLVATATGLRAADVSHGLLTLWAWCFREGRDVCTDVHLAGFFGVANVGPSLEAFDFLERVDGAWRVRGASRYLRIREARSQGGKKGGKTTQERKRNESSKSEAHLKQNQALKSFGEIKPPEALKGFGELKQNEALSPISSSTKKRGLAIKASPTPQPEPSSPEPNPSSAPPPPGPGGAGQGRNQIPQPDTAPDRPVEERPPDCPPDFWEALTHPRPQTELEQRCLKANPRDYDATNRDFRAWAEERNTTHRKLRDWVAMVHAEKSYQRRKVLIHAGPPSDSWPRAQPVAELAEVTA